MMNKESDSILKVPGVLDFVQVAASYCALVEPSSTPIWTTETLLECRKLLADVYAKGLQLPELFLDPFAESPRQVTEEAYEAVRGRLERVLGSEDRFLNAQMEEMKYSDRPVSVSTAEILADIYQALGDFVWAIRLLNEPAMYQAVAEVQHSMQERWGSLLLAALRQLHDLSNDPDFELQEDGAQEDISNQE